MEQCLFLLPDVGVQLESLLPRAPWLPSFSLPLRSCPSFQQRHTFTLRERLERRQINHGNELRSSPEPVAQSPWEDSDPAVSAWTDATVFCPASLDYNPGDSCGHWPASQFKFEKKEITAGHFCILQILKCVDTKHSRKPKREESGHASQFSQSHVL